MDYEVRFSGEEDGMGEMDDGARCTEHVGEVFRPRCTQCDELREEGSLDDWDTVEEAPGEPLPLAS